MNIADLSERKNTSFIRVQGQGLGVKVICKDRKFKITIGNCTKGTILIYLIFNISMDIYFPIFNLNKIFKNYTIKINKVISNKMFIL